MIQSPLLNPYLDLVQQLKTQSKDFQLKVSRWRAGTELNLAPIRAGMVKLEKLRYLFWNSYRFYAHGIVDEWTQHLTPPQWYNDLGSTPAERQRAYRLLFRKYLEQFTPTWTQFLSYFIGDALWVRKMETNLKEQLQANSLASARASPT